ncbi:hypothetical protein [Brunnivagina elsteri]|uniref:Uncharacterized protein n=1 Tax=Brunnivagina elsteri CCALA 953 TaxID=987040 RepID=A0A2A2TE31_9CYAN|nr:hypothetical protein [Calothrix elsteri]PAX52010.1 hypothetical protein CK510_21645 [Calothrix elsteri CCALA 953]
MARRPGTRQRFSKLIEKFKASGGTGGNDQAVVQFGNYLKGLNKANVTRKPTGNAIKRYRAKVIPFGLTPSATATDRFFACTFTGQAYAIFEGLGTAKNTFGLEIVGDAPSAAGVNVDDNFFPALARVKVVPTTSTTSTRISGITKVSYKTVQGRTGSIPFGRGGTGVKDAQTQSAEVAINEIDEQDVATTIISLLKGLVTTSPAGVVASVTIVPESFVPVALASFTPSSPPTITL